MAALTLHHPAGDPVLRCRPARVYIDGSRRRELVVTRWEVLPAPRFGRARLQLHRPGVSSVRLQDVHLLPEPGAEVTIRAAVGGAGGELPGVVTRRITAAGADGEGLSVEVAHRLGQVLSDPVSGRHVARAGGVFHAPDLDLEFNTSPDTLRSPAPVEFEGQLVPVFAPDPDAVRWTVADALIYLLAVARANAVDRPSPETIDLLCGEVELPPMRLAGLSALDALVKVAGAAGLEIRAARSGLGLVFYRPGRDGVVKNVRLQPAGRAMNPTQTNLAGGTVSLAGRRALRPVLVRGSLKKYEATFTLQPGWDASRETGRWRDTVRSRSEDWDAMADVYRKWVLNEHGRYSGWPWNLPAFDFSHISEEDFVSARARPLLPCLSADKTGRSFGVVVEVACGYEAEFRRWEGPVRISRTEGTLWLEGDALPGDFYRAAIAGAARVRVTATIVSDRRLQCRLPGGSDQPLKTLDLGDRYGWARVHESSIFHDPEQAAAGERDDTDLLCDAAARRQQQMQASTEAEFTLGWIDTSYHVGDIITRIDGRALELTGPAGPARVVRVVHDYTDSQSTQIIARS